MSIHNGSNIFTRFLVVNQKDRFDMTTAQPEYLNVINDDTNSNEVIILFWSNSSEQVLLSVSHETFEQFIADWKNDKITIEITTTL